MFPEFQVGNQYSRKLKTPEQKKAAYDSYCEHIVSGNSKESWVFECPEINNLTWESMETYMKNERDFPPDQMKAAKAKSFGVWEKVVHESARGTNKDASTASLQMLMRNKFGWDKPEKNTLVDNVEINLNYEKVMHQLSDFQKSALAEALENSIDQHTVPNEVVQQ